MKRLKFLIVGLLVTTVSIAQTEKSASTQFTDEDLKKYAITQDSVLGMQQTLNQIIAENVQKNTVMEVKRYNELFKVEKDQAKLTALNATPEEIAFLKDIAALRDYNVQRINSTYQALAKEYVGLKQFNAIKKALSADAKLKERYDAINQEIKSEAASASANESKGR